MARFLLTSTLGLLMAIPQVFGARTVDLPRGTAIQIRLTEPVSSETNKKGDRFTGVLDEDITENNNMLARRGDRVTGELVRVHNDDDRNGDLVELTLTELRAGNQTYKLDTNNIIVTNKKGSDNRDAATIGGGAGIGAVIGAIAGGVKGAIIGAAVGAGAGAAAVLITDEKDVEFDTEQKFRFYLERDVDMAVLSEADLDRRAESRDDSPYLRGDSTDEDWRHADDDDVISSRNRESIREVVDSLDRRADHVWSMVQDDSDFLNDSRSGSSREAEDRSALYMALSNFANSTESLRKLINDSRQVDYRGGARTIVRQAEDIDAMFRRTNTFGHLQDDWSEVQREVERLGNTFDIAYSLTGSSTYRAE